MKNIGTVEFRGRPVYVQVTDEGHVYVAGAPVEQYPRELRDLAIRLKNRREDERAGVIKNRMRQTTRSAA